MPLLQLVRLDLAFGHVPLLDQVGLVVEAGDRIGLIGRNGAGKSSLLKIAAGQIKPDDGTVWVQPGTKLAYVPQEPQLNDALPIFDVVSDGLGEAKRALLDYHEAAVRLEQGDSDPAWLERLHQAENALAACDGWNAKSRVDTVLTRLGLNGDKLIAGLSGGQKKRVALAQALVAQPDLLLLDEPTNHLDMDSIQWLETLLQEFRGSVLLITHDRRFLDAVSNRIVELDRGQLSEFAGNFSQYQQKKAEMLAVEADHQAKFDKFLAQEEVWIRKGVEARRTRNEGRVRRLERLRLDRAARRELAGGVKLALDAGERSGKLVAELTHVSMSYAGRPLIRDFSCRILRGDKIGLIGPNGSGKSTLLKLILGEIRPESGMVEQGTKLSIAYFDQFRAQLDEEASLSDVISPGSEWVEINGERKHVISYLEDFLFAPARARSPVKSLSGGERNRLLLARLFAKPANVLVLDEPTNDLDIETLEVLESLLQDYHGTVLIVSHDRAFLDNVVTQVFAFEGNGSIREYVGGYDDWMRQRSGQPEAPGKPAQGAKVDSKAARGSPSPAKTRLSFNETRELAALPERISALEAEQAELTGRLGDPLLYQNEADKVAGLQARFEAIEMELLTCLDRWEVLEAKQSAAKGGSSS